ncbi:hypothetical protein PILCRDRAFT_818473 [Piloderma croceum F 1598]|uniref:Uncharacterized protein n=1 Tax=Piloderma croceum (strain F 1598) TaxID=765440 RepID=A0A0C3FX85_PILCF|nr:hypothetical protein PILCRDRAFT_818473 [Piloderma croceum F 1598]
MGTAPSCFSFGRFLPIANLRDVLTRLGCFGANSGILLNAPHPTLLATGVDNIAFEYPRLYYIELGPS